jgi:hypothetical protein
MAKYTGMFPYKGTINGITCYETKHGIIVKQKSSISKERIMKAPEYARTRENISDFSTAARSNKLLRQAFWNLICQAKDKTLLGRLTKQIIPIMKLDTVNLRGRRSLQDAPLEMLKGFNFNNNAKLENTFYIPFEIIINRKAGLALINLPLFDHMRLLPPEGASHYKLVTAVSEIDFNTGIHNTTYKETDVMPLNNVPVLPMTRSHSIPKNTRQIIFVCFGIQFFQECNKDFYPVKNGSSNPLSIIDVDRP